MGIVALRLTQHGDKIPQDRDRIVVFDYRNEKPKVNDVVLPDQTWR